MEYIKFLPPLVGVLTLIYSMIKSRKINNATMGNKQIEDLSIDIRDYINQYLDKFYIIVCLYFIFMSLFILLLANLALVANFLAGGLFSIILAKIGVDNTSLVGLKIANISMVSGKDRAYREILKISSILAMLIPAMGIIGIGLGLTIFSNNDLYLSAFIFGVASVSAILFIYNGVFIRPWKMDLKDEDGEDQEKDLDKINFNNYISSYVNGAISNYIDYFVSYVSLFLVSNIFGKLVFGESSRIYILIIAIGGILLSILSLEYLIKNEDVDEDSFDKINIFIILSLSLIALAGSYFLLKDLRFFIPVILACSSNLIMNKLAKEIHINSEEYLASNLDISENSQISNLLSSLSVGINSSLLPISILIILILISFYICAGGQSVVNGIFGISIGGFSLVSLSGYRYALSLYNTIASYSMTVTEELNFPENIYDINKSLKNLGNNGENENKGYEILITALTGFSLILYYFQLSELTSIDIAKPIVVVGLIIGVGQILLIASILVSSVNTIIKLTNYEDGIAYNKDDNGNEDKIEGYHKFIEKLSKTSIKPIYQSIIILIIVPLLLGLFFGLEALGGVLIGVLVTAIIIGIIAMGSGTYWYEKRANKDYLSRNHGDNLENSVVITSYIGKFFKEILGPSLFSLVKYIIIISIVFSPLFIRFSGLFT